MLSREGLIAEIDVLEGLLDREILDELNRLLEVIALLTGNAQLITLNSNLHFDFCALDALSNLGRDLAIDTLFDLNALA